MILLIDNYDSFTYNLVHYLRELGSDVMVKRNDALTCQDALASQPKGIVISPGPCTPDDSGICLDLIRENAVRKDSVVPILGVCLGHQAIGQAFGGTVIRAPQPMHGKVSPILHDRQSVLAGLPSPFPAARYHSLLIEHTSLPSCLEITAHTQDDLIMGIRHRDLPLHGVQFHPESIATDHGKRIVNNFLQLI